MKQQRLRAGSIGIEYAAMNGNEGRIMCDGLRQRCSGCLPDFYGYVNCYGDGSQGSKFQPMDLPCLQARSFKIVGSKEKNGSLLQRGKSEWSCSRLRIGSNLHTIECRLCGKTYSPGTGTFD